MQPVLRSTLCKGKIRYKRDCEKKDDNDDDDNNKNNKNNNDNNNNNNNNNSLYTGGSRHWKVIFREAL